VRERALAVVRASRELRTGSAAVRRADRAALPRSSPRRLAAAGQRALVIGWRWLLSAVALVAAALLALALFAR
jgi:hypothetical protein